MDLNKNLAAILNTVKSERRKSMTEFSEELEISRSALQKYLSGAGNPNLTTIEHIAQKLSISPYFLLLGDFSEEQLNAFLKMTDILSLLSDLPPEKRKRFAELLFEMISLWDSDDENGKVPPLR